jgi:hypothetical protein
MLQQPVNPGEGLAPWWWTLIYDGCCFIPAMFTSFIIGIIIMHFMKGKLDYRFVLMVAFINVLPIVAWAISINQAMFIWENIESLRSFFISDLIASLVVGTGLMLYRNHE